MRAMEAKVKQEEEQVALEKEAFLDKQDLIAAQRAVKEASTDAQRKRAVEVEATIKAEMELKAAKVGVGGVGRCWLRLVVLVDVGQCWLRLVEVG